MTFCGYVSWIHTNKLPIKEKHMLIGSDKRGSINLPVGVRKEFGLGIGSYLELSIESGGGYRAPSCVNLSQHQSQ